MLESCSEDANRAAFQRWWAALQGREEASLPRCAAGRVTSLVLGRVRAEGTVTWFPQRRDERPLCRVALAGIEAERVTGELGDLARGWRRATVSAPPPAPIDWTDDDAEAPLPVTILDLDGALDGGGVERIAKQLGVPALAVGIAPAADHLDVLGCDPRRGSEHVTVADFDGLLAAWARLRPCAALTPWLLTCPPGTTEPRAVVTPAP